MDCILYTLCYYKTIILSVYIFHADAANANKEQSLSSYARESLYFFISNLHLIIHHADYFLIVVYLIVYYISFLNEILFILFSFSLNNS